MITTSALLDAWEAAARCAPAARPLALLSLALPGAATEDLARLPLGQRDASLLRLRQALFGDSIDCLVARPACAAELEFAVSVRDLLRQHAETLAGEYLLEAAGYRIRFRPPDSADLIALARCDAPAEQYPAVLLPRCVIAAEGLDGALEPSDLPPDVVDLLTDEMECRDPLVSILLELACERCDHAWQSLFDVATFLWVEVDRLARIRLRDVHTLARIYGWRESDVLALSDARRNRYLAMAEA